MKMNVRLFSLMRGRAHGPHPLIGTGPLIPGWAFNIILGGLSMNVRHVRALSRCTLALALSVLTAELVLATAEAQDSGLVGKADAVYQNGFVYTVDGVRRRAEAFAVRDGKRCKLGQTNDIRPRHGDACVG
jgi:hypothetical protein